MNRTSIASAVAPGNPGAAWQFQGASDVNGDGKDDLLFMNPITDQAQTWLMNGTQVASMQAPVSVPAAAQPSAPVLSEMETSFCLIAASNRVTVSFTNGCSAWISGRRRLHVG